MKNIKQFCLKLADLFLTFEKDSRDWRHDKQLLKAYRILFYVVLVGVILYYLPSLILDTQNSVSAAFWARVFTLLALFIITLSQIILSIFYCKAVLRNTIKIKLSNLSIFYLSGIILFGLIYYTTYRIRSDYFNYQDPVLIPQQTIKYVGLKGYRGLMDFIIYSASNMLQSSYWKVSARSLVVSTIEIFQKLYSLFIIIILSSLWISRFRNNSKRDTSGSNQGSGTS